MSGAIAEALLPPAILAPLALILVLNGRRRGALLTAAALVATSLEVFSHLLTASLLLPPRPPPREPAGAIVVLAADAPEILESSRAEPGVETLQRLRTAAALSRRLGVPILVGSGRGSDDGEPAADTMARSLSDDFRLSARWVERGSTNLWQSAAAAAAALKAEGVHTIMLVAQPSELRLGSAVFTASGLSVMPAPVSDRAWRTPDSAAFLPISPAWFDSARVLRQWAGLACQALRPCVDWMRAGAPAPGRTRRS